MVWVETIPLCQGLVSARKKPNRVVAETETCNEKLIIFLVVIAHVRIATKLSSNTTKNDQRAVATRARALGHKRGTNHSMFQRFHLYHRAHLLHGQCRILRCVDAARGSWPFDVHPRV